MLARCWNWNKLSPYEILIIINFKREPYCGYWTLSITAYMSEEKIPSQISDAVTNQSPDYIYLKTGKINSFMFSVLVSVRFMKPFVSTSDSGIAPWYCCRETLGILLHFNLNLKLSPKIVISLKSYFICKKYVNWLSIISSSCIAVVHLLTFGFLLKFGSQEEDSSYSQFVHYSMDFLGKNIRRNQNVL